MTAINPAIIIGNPVLETDSSLGQILDSGSSNQITPETEPDWPIALIFTNEDRFGKIRKKQSRTLGGYIVHAQTVDAAISPQTARKPQALTLLRLPQYLKNKIRQTLRNDLPRSVLHKKEIFHEIETKPDARMPRIPPHKRSPKEEGEIVKIVDELVEKRFIEPSLALRWY